LGIDPGRPVKGDEASEQQVCPANMSLTVYWFALNSAERPLGVNQGFPNLGGGFSPYFEGTRRGARQKVLKVIWRGTHRAKLEHRIQMLRVKLVSAMSKVTPLINKLRPKCTVDFCGVTSTTRLKSNPRQYQPAQLWSVNLYFVCKNV
jgi:hypothetical protein